MIHQKDFSVWSVSILGGTPHKIVDHVTFPSVSPDGSLVAFSRFDLTFETAEIWVVNANGESQRRIRAPSESDRVRYFNPVWSSNGQRLFYRRSDDKNEGIESCTLAGDKVTTVFSSNDYALRWDLCWAPEGRILFPMAEKGLGAEIFNLWEIKVDAITGKPMSGARRFIQWSGFSFVNAGSLSITADGKQLALARTNAQADVYVAEIDSGGKTIKNRLKNFRRFTQVESDDFVWDWTADSRAVFFESDRYGHQDIFKQYISQTNPETIIAGPENYYHPNLSPDGAFILYLVSVKRGELATRLMRIPVGGGPPELVLSGEKIRNFSCAREAKLCVVAEEVEGKQILTQFDPLKGRGEKLPWSDYPNFEWGILSPQGGLIEKMKPGPDGLHIRVRWLAGKPAEEIVFKSLTGDDYQLSGWSPDGQTIYLQERLSGWSVDGQAIYLQEWGVPSDSYFRMLFAGLDGHSYVEWQSTGQSIHGLIPSPDGQHLAFTAITYEANAWLLQNF
jgi:Tol biopolymer transport system component